MALTVDLGVSLADRLRDALADGDAQRIQELVEAGASLTADKVRLGQVEMGRLGSGR